MLRRYRGFVADSARWEGFEPRDGDIIISTPSKCGTTWMQNIVGMLVFGRVELGAPLSELSPWFDMQIYTDAEMYDLLAAQTHRRFIKTHTPLDGVPEHDSVDYVAVIRHPLDVVLSDLDHERNSTGGRARELRVAANGSPDAMPELVWPDSDEPAAFFRQGGRRDWRSLLSDDELDHFDRRLRELAGPAAEWVLHGRSAL